MARRTIWGFTMEVKEGRRTYWPASIKDEAVRRIKAGTLPEAVAEELGAHPALVRKWRIKDRRKNGDCSETPVRFAEFAVNPPEAGDPIPVLSPVMCRLHFGGMIFEFPSEIVPEDLARIIGILRAVP